MANPMEWSAAKAAKLLTVVCFVSCSHRDPGKETYLRAWHDYVLGNFSGVVEEAGRSLKEPPNSENFSWYWKIRLLKAEALTVQSKTVEAAALIKDPIPGGPDSSQLEVRRLIDLATLRTQRTDEANQYLARARATVSDPELSIRVKLIEGILAAANRNADAANKAFEAGLASAVNQQDLYWQAVLLVHLCYSYRTGRHYDESLTAGLRGLDLAEKLQARRVAAQAHGNLGSTYSFLGAYEPALQHEEQATQMLEAVGDRANLVIGLGELSLIYDYQGERQKAISGYERAYKLATEMERPRDAARNATNLATALIRSEQYDAATEWNQRAYDLSTQIGDKDAIPYLVRNKARIAYGRGQPEEAARICEEFLRSYTGEANLEWAIHGLLGTIHADAKRFSQANREFESALRLIDDTRASVQTPNYRITFFSRLIPFYQEYVDALARQDDESATLKIVDSSRARVLKERLGRDVEAGQLPDRANLPRLAKAANSFLLSFWIAPQHSFAWLISADRVRRFDLPGESEIAKEVIAYRSLVEHAQDDPVATHDPAGPQLWNTLVAKIAPEIPKGSRLIVIPDGPLHRLNLETLIAPLPQPHYWIEDVEITVAPSLALAVAAPAMKPARDSSVLLIGAADYTGTGFETLKTAASEISDIQGLFPNVTQFTGAKATPAAYAEASPGQFTIIHFAAHAEANREKPLDSAVILARQRDQFRLYARDVSDLRLQANLVTISACASAGTRSYAGEGLMGFAWAFLHAGARSVVAGLWDVSDRSTEPLMKRFYSGIAAGQSPASAMRTAKLDLSRSEVRYRKPYYWAPFQVYAGSLK
jgi:CHAT domain-containing protein